MTGQIEGDKRTRLKGERFPSLSLIAGELQFSELNRAYNTQYLLQFGQFSNKQKNPLPSHQFDCQWLNCFSLRGTQERKKDVTLKIFYRTCTRCAQWSDQDMAFQGQKECYSAQGHMGDAHSCQRESTQLRKNTSSTLPAPDKMLQCSKFLQHALPGHASMEIQERALSWGETLNNALHTSHETAS